MIPAAKQAIRKRRRRKGEFWIRKGEGDLSVYIVFLYLTHGCDDP
jgi:hypothetical protein